MEYIIRMKTTTLKFFLLAFAFQVSVFAGEEKVTVTFLKGKVFVIADKNEAPVSIGQELAVESKIKTLSSSMLSFSYRGGQYRVSANQTIHLKEIVGSQDSSNSSFFNKILRRENEPKPTIVAGVRGKPSLQNNAGANAPDYHQLIGEGKYQEVIDSLIHPEVFQEWKFLALAYDGLNKYPEAVKSLESGLSKAVREYDKMDAFYNLGLLHTKYGEYGKAIKCLLEVTQLAKDQRRISPETWYLLIKNSEMTGDDDSAKKYRGKLIKFHPNNLLARSESKS
ncbi:MAG: tetratricopeptide repeat protein [Spirochaetia bacterium]|nr:tetratricopeptide repeat protein [Spirochaetia bacterium]